MLTKTRKESALQTTSLYVHRRRKRFAPLQLIGLCVTALLLVGGVAAFVVSRTNSHAADANPNCTLIVPSQPLTAQGLATPYLLEGNDNGPCHETNVAQSAFVQGVIYDQDSGKFSVYSPLVIDKGMQPAVKPVVPTLPAHAIVGIWFGFNGTNLTLKGARRNALTDGQCVNGLDGSIFGQFAYCNAAAFFSAANSGLAQGKFTIPPLGTAKDGMPCMTSRDFGLVDQDQSDNVQTRYLANEQGQIAQFSVANQRNIANATTIANPSDNALLTRFVDPVLGCSPWQAPDLADNGALVSALPLDEMQAAAYQQAPIALVPLTNPMTLKDDQPSLRKTNLYRAGTDQTPAATADQASGTTYCKNLVTTGLARLKLDRQFTQDAASPMADAANSLFTFLAQRFNASYTNLNCQQLLQQPNPVTVQTNGDGVAIGATFGNGDNNAAQATPTLAQATPTPIQATPTPIQTTPTPTQATPMPTQATSTTTQATPIPIQATPMPTQATPTPIQATPMPTQNNYNGYNK